MIFIQLLIIKNDEALIKAVFKSFYTKELLINN